MAVAPAVQIEVQREKELETIRRGEEIAEAIRQYVVYYKGTKLPNRSTICSKAAERHKKTADTPAVGYDRPAERRRQMASCPAGTEDNSGVRKKVQEYNHGLLPSSPEPQYSTNTRSA